MSSTAVTNPFQACNDIFLKPNQVFHSLLSHHNWSWLPFIAVCAIAALPSYLYFGFVDIDWYQDMFIQTQMADVSPAEQDMMRQSLTRDGMQLWSLIGSPLMVILFNAVVAAYLNVATRMDEENLNGFTDWFGFSWWASMPILVTGFISLIVIAMAGDHQLPFENMYPLTLAYWLGLDMSSDWLGVAQFISLDRMWTVYLVAVGIGQWTQIPRQTATLLAIAPFAVIAGVWSLFVAM